MNIIVAVDKAWGIGRENKLLAHIPEDMNYFKCMTMGKTVVMGANTFLSLPNGPLPNRENLILSSRLGSIDGAKVFKTADALFSALKGRSLKDVFIIGGAQIYELFLPFCSVSYITKINSLLNADTFFPNLDQNKAWSCISVSETTVSCSFEINFCAYKNRSPKNL